MHEFARVSRAIIQVAVISKKLPEPSINFKTVFGDTLIKKYGITTVKAGFAKICFRIFNPGGLKKSLDAEIIQRV
jgi:hypothetical protein